MKKIFLMTIGALMCVSMASPVFASTTFNGTIGTTAAVSTMIGGAVYVPSTGVYVNVASITTAYCVTAVHNSALGKDAGKEYGSTSEGSTIENKVASGISSIEQCATPTAGATVVLPGTNWVM